MRFSEAISLGHTLIGEDREVFYDPTKKCGCAIGSAWAACTEDLGAHPMGVHGLFPMEWVVSRWPWLATEASVELIKELRLPVVHGGTVAELVSYAHHTGKRTRMEIAEIIARYEPAEPAPVEVEQREAVAQ